MLSLIYRFLFHSLKLKINKIVQVRRNGLFYILDLNGYTSLKIFLRSAYEERDFSKLLGFVEKGDVCIDVGSNVGFYSLNFARACGDDGKVFAFEPNRKNYLMQSLSAELNHFSHLHLFNYVVSDRTDERFEQIIPYGDSSLTFFKQSNQESLNNADQLTSMTLDQLYPEIEKADKTVKVLKIDVEGAEYKVLQGGNHFLSGKYAPQVVMVEISKEHLGRFGSNPNDVYQELNGHGYRYCYVSDGRGFSNMNVKELDDYRGNVFLSKTTLN